MAAASHTSTEIRQALRSLGLSDNQIKILSVLFHIHRGTTKQISELTAITFSFAECSLQALVKIGLVKIHHHQEKDMFEVCSHQELLAWIDEKKRQHKEIYDDAKGTIRSFLKKVSHLDWKPKVAFHEGFDGIKEVYEDTLSGDHEKIYGFENIAEMAPEVKKYILEDYIPRRAEKNIPIRVLTPDNKIHEGTRKNDEKFLRETKFFDKSIIPVEIEMNIYGDRVALFSYKKEEMFAVILESPAIANSMRSIFECCWLASD